MTGLFVGLTTLDVAYLVDSYPVEDSKNQALDQFLGAGGPAANAAVAYAFLSATSPTLLTALGAHPLTGISRADLAAADVTIVDAAAESTAPLPISSITVAREAHTRTVVSLDAARTTAPYRDDHADLLTGVDVVLVDGHYGDLSLRLAGSAQAQGIPVVLDAGRWKDVHRELLSVVDVAICSAAFDPPGNGPVVERIHRLGPAYVAVSQGPESILWSGPDGRGDIVVEAVDAVDTLGAGDILHGAFCHYFTRGNGFAESLRRAAKVAGESCRWFGTREWMRHSAELRS